MALVPQDQTLEAEVLQDIAAVRLYEAQVEVAKYLELAYISVSDHPDVAKKVRLTAHAARTQHSMTKGLMKSFTVTAKHIVGTMIPMIYDAVELKDKDLVKECFALTMKMAERMKNESTQAKERYQDIRLDVQENMSSMNKTNKEVEKKQKEIGVTERKEKKLAEENRKKIEELEREKANMDEELKDLKKCRGKWMKGAEDVMEKLREEDDKTFLDSVIVPPDSDTVVGLGKAIVETSVNIIGRMFGRNSKKRQFKNMMHAFKESNESVDKRSAEKREILKQKEEQTKERLERLAMIEKLGIETAQLGDPLSLVEALTSLGIVDKQFDQLIEFWENMVIALQYLIDDTQSGEVYLNKVQDPEYAERFKGSIDRADKGWQGFGKICSDYVKSCTDDPNVSIQVLYTFLSVAPENVSHAQRGERMKMLISDIKDNFTTGEVQFSDAKN